MGVCETSNTNIISYGLPNFGSDQHRSQVKTGQLITAPSPEEPKESLIHFEGNERCPLRS